MHLFRGARAALTPSRPSKQNLGMPSIYTSWCLPNCAPPYMHNIHRHRAGLRSKLQHKIAPDHSLDSSPNEETSRVLAFPEQENPPPSPRINGKDSDQQPTFDAMPLRRPPLLAGHRLGHQWHQPIGNGLQNVWNRVEETRANQLHVLFL